MLRPETKQILQLLVTVYNTAITDYYYFPEIIFAGAKKIDRADFEFLRAEGYVRLYKHDSFGGYYRHTKKCEALLHDELQPKHPRKKATVVPLTQGCFYFSRNNTPNASGSRCLLFF